MFPNFQVPKAPAGVAGCVFFCLYLVVRADLYFSAILNDQDPQAANLDQLECVLVAVFQRCQSHRHFDGGRL